MNVLISVVFTNALRVRKSLSLRAECADQRVRKNEVFVDFVSNFLREARVSKGLVCHGLSPVFCRCLPWC